MIRVAGLDDAADSAGHGSNWGPQEPVHAETSDQTWANRDRTVQTSVEHAHPLVLCEVSRHD